MSHADRPQESGNLWRCNLSEQKNSRVAYGKIIVPGHMAALRRAAETCAVTRHRCPVDPADAALAVSELYASAGRGCDRGHGFP
jgi:hypothetical protein